LLILLRTIVVIFLIFARYCIFYSAIRLASRKCV